MGLSEQQLKPIKEDFMAKYLTVAPLSEYFSGCGISNLRIKQETTKSVLPLRKGESLDDLCLHVLLNREPSKDIKLPSEYRGVRVFYQVVGEITMQ